MSSDAPPPSTMKDGRRQQEYDIRAPEGGMRAAINNFESGTVEYIDLVISKRRGQFIHVRIFRMRSLVRWDTRRPMLFRIDGGECAQIADNEVITPLRPCSGWINTEVTTSPLPTGKLSILFNQGEEPL